MRRLLAIVMLLPLAGCFEDQKQQAASCDAEAQRTYPTERRETGSKWAAYVDTCMTAHEYDWRIGEKRCEVVNGMEANPYCYIPSGWLSRAIYRIEVGSASN